MQVTKLDRDPSSGTALQEISFWLNLERALLKIQDKRESLEVALTLDVLKHGKRFHATVSFDTDTGKQKCRFLIEQGEGMLGWLDYWFKRSLFLLNEYVWGNKCCVVAILSVAQ